MAKVTKAQLRAELVRAQERVLQVDKAWKVEFAEAVKARDAHAEEYAKQLERAQKAEAANVRCEVHAQSLLDVARRHSGGPCSALAAPICPTHLEVERKAANEYAESLQREIEHEKAEHRRLARAVERLEQHRALVTVLISEAQAPEAMTTTETTLRRMFQNTKAYRR